MQGHSQTRGSVLGEDKTFSTEQTSERGGSREVSRQNTYGVDITEGAYVGGRGLARGSQQPRAAAWQNDACTHGAMFFDFQQVERANKSCWAPCMHGSGTLPGLA